MGGVGQRQPFVFLSYARPDHSAAQRLVDGLRARGIQVWSDMQLRVGEEWKRVITDALEKADVIVVLVSRRSLDSHWVTTEWQTALSRSQRVIPVIIDSVAYADLPQHLLEIQALDLTWGDYAEKLDELSDAVKELSASPEPPPAQEVEKEQIVEDVVDRTYKRFGFDTREEPKSVKIDDRSIFVVISFNPAMDPTYLAIKSAAERVGMRAERIKDIKGDFRITDTILERIETARLVVVDLTLESPNVYFELGYARGKKKTIVTLLKEGSKAHVDVAGWNYLEYFDSRPLEEDLVDRFRAELRDD